MLWLKEQLYLSSYKVLFVCTFLVGTLCPISVVFACTFLVGTLCPTRIFYFTYPFVFLFFMRLCGIVRHNDLGHAELGGRVWQYNFIVALGLNGVERLEIEMHNVWSVLLMSLPR